MVEYVNAAQIAGNLSNNPVVNSLKHLNNVVGSTPVDAFMDSVSGMGHRLAHGHDISYLPEIYSKYGLKGVKDFFAHMTLDVMSPHGVPIFPGAKKFGSLIGLNTKQSTDWLCVNIGDLIGGGLSVFHSAITIKSLIGAKATGYIGWQLLANTMIGSGLKIGTAILVPNPISLASGIVDLGALIVIAGPIFYNGEWHYFIPKESLITSIGKGAVYGGIVATAIGAPLESIRSYIYYKGGKYNKKQAIVEALSGTLGFSIAGLFAGAAGGAAASLWGIPILTVCIGAGTYIGAHYSYNRFLRKRVSYLISRASLKIKLPQVKKKTVLLPDISL
jgi:hypothetical protein